MQKPDSVFLDPIMSNDENITREKWVAVDGNGNRTHSGVLSESEALEEAKRATAINESGGGKPAPVQAKQILEG